MSTQAELEHGEQADRAGADDHASVSIGGAQSRVAVREIGHGCVPLRSGLVGDASASSIRHAKRNKLLQ